LASKHQNTFIESQVFYHRRVDPVAAMRHSESSDGYDLEV